MMTNENENQDQNQNAAQDGADTGANKRTRTMRRFRDDGNYMAVPADQFDEFVHDATGGASFETAKDAIANVTKDAEQSGRFLVLRVVDQFDLVPQVKRSTRVVR